MTNVSILCNTCNTTKLLCKFCIKYVNKGKFIYLEKSMMNSKKQEKKIEDDTINHRQLQIYSKSLLKRL